MALVGPIVGDTSWLTCEQTGFAKTAFAIDWGRWGGMIDGLQTFMQHAHVYHDALQSARTFQTTDDLKVKHRGWAGSEGTYARALRGFGVDACDSRIR